jgi:hypothetical protein
MELPAEAPFFATRSPAPEKYNTRRNKTLVHLIRRVDDPTHFVGENVADEISGDVDPGANDPGFRERSCRAHTSRRSSRRSREIAADI